MCTASHLAGRGASATRWRSRLLAATPPTTATRLQPPGPSAANELVAEHVHHTAS